VRLDGLVIDQPQCRLNKVVLLPPGFVSEKALITFCRGTFSCEGGLASWGSNATFVQIP